MISLRESWRVQRKQRQYEVGQRQQQVHETLAQFQQTRQAKATVLREELRLFQLDLQLDIQEFLAQAYSQRQVQTEELMQQLDCFTQSLREQTAQLVAMYATDRTAKAQRVSQNLSEFHVDLSLSVTLLRQKLQQHIQDLRIEVKTIFAESQELIKSYTKERIENRIQQIHALTAWMETLQADVQNYLTELSLVRNDRASQVQQMLQIERDRRYAEVSELFQQLGAFRSELKTYCAELRQSVWGEDTSVSPGTQFSDRNGTANGGTIGNGTVAKRSVDLPRSQQISKTTLPKNGVGNGQAGNKAAKQPAKRLSTAKRAPAPPSAKPKTSTELPRVGTLPVSASPVASGAADRHSMPHPLVDPVEQRVYAHLEETHGARLTEIEVALAINRFQAVDALRSLIKKGLVTQRDRMYLIQEDMSL